MIEGTNDLVLITDKVEIPTPNYELAQALIDPAERIALDISRVFDRLGPNDKTSFPMEKVDGFTPEPISMLVVRQVDAESNPVETLQVMMKDRSTVEVVLNEKLVASYTRDKSAPDQAKWVRIPEDKGTLEDNVSFDALIHSQLTNLANKSAYQENPENCAAIVNGYLDVNPIENIFVENHNRSNNFKNSSSTG